MKTQTELLATFGYLGKAPVAPGTFGTLGALPLAFAFMQLGPIGYMAATVLFAGFSIWVAQAYEAESDSHDASEVVIDEVAGGLIAFTWLTTWQAFLAAFVIFRLLDALKTPPIGWADKKIDGGLGVVADDLIAGVITSIIMQILLVETTHFGVPINPFQ
ncbi:MAG: phosphatidylglycerophosphatase A [Pseudomonadota bacterium]